MSNLIKAEKYALFTFNTTSHALKAEKVLKALGAEFLIVPTLREISSSCGLSVKLSWENIEKYYNDLLENKVPVEGVFRVEKEGKKNNITKIEMA
ncbi:Protein of unknown function [Thermosyntropha lipolytica DSM 11003]|uniref:Putative Se/S carrier protein-like domain-containing protein n=1 Tax=Thermosyntropha lipolytica DSM 11003 TaxID=1123382 RepID=A0A1M5PF31_9FIRM|nr:DUF3343 domain-containing protein [Thermosyntropha lipolytica]SHH00318.1 Protein of unknown function [Thermosyntropha lipolytica DSM 11003]